MLDTKPKSFIFVLMPFDEKFDDAYKLGIKPACQAAGAYCERVDEQIFQESILERIYNQIAKADLIVSDMTDRNPNVFYETGYAHALGKKVILLTQRAEDIPFDLKHYPHIIYSGKITKLKDDLERQVGWYLQEPDTTVVEPHRELEFYTSGQKIAEGLDINIYQNDYKSYGDETLLKFNFSIHNPTNRIIDISGLAIGLILPSTVILDGMSRNTRLPDGQVMVEARIYSERITPQSWDSSTFMATLPTKEMIPGSGFPCVVRVFSHTGVIDIPFTVRLGGIRTIE
jgi:hypothetical protein